jgi:hypothetical protein
VKIHGVNDVTTLRRRDHDCRIDDVCLPRLRQCFTNELGESPAKCFDSQALERFTKAPPTAAPPLGKNWRGYGDRTILFDCLPYNEEHAPVVPFNGNKGTRIERYSRPRH